MQQDPSQSQYEELNVESNDAGPERPQKTKQQDIRELWALFSAAKDRDQYCQGWLSLQCTRIPGVDVATLVLISPEGLQPVALWPQGAEASQDLTDLIEEVIREGSGLVHSLPEGRFGAALPVRMDDQMVGVIAARMSVDVANLSVVMEQFQWGSSWVELLLRRLVGKEQAVQQQLQEKAVSYLAAVLCEHRFTAASMALVNELATDLLCDRVSFGLCEGGRVKVVALSHNAQFGQKMNLIRCLAAAMEEAVLQGELIQWPASEEKGKVIREHGILSSNEGGEQILTLPLHSGDDYFGALTLERPANMPFLAHEISQVEAVAALAGEALLDKRRVDRPLLFLVGKSLWQQVERLLGAGYLGRKLFVLVFISIVAFFSVATGTYRVAADSSLQGAVRRVIVAPFDGYIQTAVVRAGDRVSDGQVMSTLDDRDLRLERLGILSERAKFKRQHTEAVAGGDRAESRIILAQLEQNQAQLDLIESKLKRTQLTAPFDGLVVSGDLSQRLGGATQQGELLFEVAPLDLYRVILWVDEHQITDLKVGQLGQLVLNALPNKTFNFTLTRITPVTEARDGGNFFRIESMLQDPQGQLSPGLEGVGKIQVDERKLIWIWTRSLLQWFELKLWSWWP